jgi:glycosyltransferase involved in cell wall biosynthesis
MRAGQFTDCYVPVLNGVTMFVRLFKRTLAAAGAEPYVFTTGHTRHPDDEPNVIRSPGFPLGPTGYYAALRYPARVVQLAQRMDVLHAHHPFLALSFAARLRRQGGQPLVFTSHTRYDLYARYYLPFLPARTAAALMSALIRRASRQCDLILAVSDAARDMLAAMRVQAPVEVVPNGIELERFTAAQPIARAALGLPPNAFVAVYVGRLGPEKNLPLLLESFAHAVPLVPGLVLALVGDGPLADDLRGQAAGLGLSDRIHFLGRYLNEDIPALVATADAFITASVSEGHPITVIEALAAGCPVVAFRAPGIQETIRDGENGLLAPTLEPGPDPAALGQTLARLALAPDLRARLALGARASARQYDIRTTARRLLGCYEALLKDRGRGSAL